MRRLAFSIIAAGAVTAAIPRAAHAVPCDTIASLTNPVYLQVGDTQLALMKRLGRAMRDNGGRSITMLFTTSGSCTNIAAIYNRTTIPGGMNMQYVPSSAENPTWDPATSPTLLCEVPTGGKVPDVANSALFNSACTTATPPATVRHARGPVQAYVMAAPRASSQTAITFEEAYFAFGFGVGGMAAPWVDESQLFIRTVTKSTLLAWAANLSVPADKWKGIRRDGSPMVVADLEGSTSPEKALGILGAEVYDGRRATLKSLAFQAKGQYAAYWPDSTPTSFDKQNVRDGHYTVWSPTIWMDTEAAGVPASADARYVVDLIAGRSVTPAPAFDVTAEIAAVGLTPDCAMGVTREFEGGPLSRYAPAESCVCKYESLVDQTRCATCSAAAPCAAGVCRNGLCEVR